MIDLVTKVIGVLAAILGLAGYVLVLGAAILWLRLVQVELPPDITMALAAREELIAIGAQAVAVWLLLAGAVGVLAAWIVTGDPKRRGFDYYEAGLALAVTVSILLALRNQPWMMGLALGATAITLVGALLFWPSVEAVSTVVVPVAVGLGLAIALHQISHGNNIATAAGAAFVFGSMLLLTPPLQRWRALQEANQEAIGRLEAKREKNQVTQRQVGPLVAALESGKQQRSATLVWVERIAAISIALVVLGVIAVASQVDRNDDFHKALVSLANGNCIEGTYIARGSDQVMVGEPEDTGEDERTRVVAIPTKEIIEVQVYGAGSKGAALHPDEKCERSKDDLSRPAVPASFGGTAAGSAQRVNNGATTAP